MDWIRQDPDLSASVIKAGQKTRVYYEDDYPAFETSKILDTSIQVTPERSFQAAMRLRKEDQAAKIAVLNFANAFHPGGGVVYGSSAQEECLCRTSTLYPIIHSRALLDSFYRHHENLGSPVATDSLIYSHGVII